MCYNTIHREIGMYYHYTAWLTFTSQIHSCNMFPGQETEHYQNPQKLLSIFCKSIHYPQGKRMSWQRIGLFFLNEMMQHLLFLSNFSLSLCLQGLSILFHVVLGCSLSWMSTIRYLNCAFCFWEQVWHIFSWEQFTLNRKLKYSHLFISLSRLF